MRHLHALAFAFILLPATVTASFAQSGSGSDVPKATARAAFPGPTTNGATQTSSNSLSSTSGTAGGGMGSAGGVKLGGQDRKSKTVVPTTGG
jgi:hypothetical protein